MHSDENEQEENERTRVVQCLGCQFEAECEDEHLSDDWSYCPKTGLPIAFMKGYDEGTLPVKIVQGSPSGEKSEE